MDPLSNMCSALVSINKILQKENDPIDDRSVSLSTTTDVLTEENFYRARLFNRTIDELPNVDTNEIQQLKSINIHTMQDILGRYLIHDTADEFYTYLLQTFHLSEKTAWKITNLFRQWTNYNIDGIKNSEQINSV